MTKGQVIEFTDCGQAVAIELEDQYAPNISIDFVWASFDDETQEVLEVFCNGVKIDKVICNDVIVQKITCKEEEKL